jgi:indoleamine 2,3-dioxygenase
VLAAFGFLARDVPGKNFDAIELFLADLATCLDAMTSTLRRLVEECRPEVFWNIMRPFLAGFGGNSSKLPDGLVYEGVTEYRGQAQSFAGASAAQSSAIPVFDIVLGVQLGAEETRFSVR